MSRPKSIALIICHLGKLPWYFAYFVHTCKYNPTVDFFIISDDPDPIWSLPGNVRLIYKTVDALEANARIKLGFEVKINNPYKLCDFKPTYGLLFSELIEGYDFWGYGDIDVIFGSIRNFMTPYVLDNHDIISVRHDFLTGYFQLFRNTAKMVTFFMNSRDYKKVLGSERHFCFDETNFMFTAFAEQIPYQDIKCEIESLMHTVCRLSEAGEIQPYFDFHVIEGLPGNLRWIDGHLFYKNKFEVMLYHLILFKKAYNPDRSVNRIRNEFRISATRFY